jgi:hypothetical protein
MSLGSLEPSPAKTPAPYGEPPRMESILNIPAPKVYPMGTNSIPWCANWVIAVQLQPIAEWRLYKCILSNDRN